MNNTAKAYQLLEISVITIEKDVVTLSGSVQEYAVQWNTFWDNNN